MEHIENLEIPVVFHKSFRARRLRVSIRPFKPVRVTFPARMPQEKAQEFLKSNIEWVKKAILKIKDLEKQTPPKIKLPEIDKTKAKVFLESQLASLAAKHGFSYNRVFVRNQKTRWGSCSSQNNINLNINLVRLPEELQNYVLLHELVHTKVRNHSRKFWNELDKYIADSKSVARKLRASNCIINHSC
jgi:predicted metal-dependent hydrolase